jgi:hypothetical protein
VKQKIPFFTYLKWSLAISGALIVFYVVYKIYAWTKTLVTVPLTAAPGKTLVQTQQDYLASKVPVPSADAPFYQGVKDVATSDDLTILDKVYLYLDTLNPFRTGGIFSSGK